MCGLISSCAWHSWELGNNWIAFFSGIHNWLWKQTLSPRNSAGALTKKPQIITLQSNAKQLGKGFYIYIYENYIFYIYIFCNIETTTVMAVLMPVILQDFCLKSDSMIGENLWRREASISIIYHLKNVKEGLHYNVYNSPTNNKVHHIIPESWWHLAVCWLHVHQGINNESPAAAGCFHSSWTLHRGLLQVSDQNPDLVKKKTPT